MSVSEGDKAPAFTMPTDGGGSIALKDLKILWPEIHIQSHSHHTKPTGLST